MNIRHFAASLLILFYLAVIDVCVNVFVPYPQDPKSPRQSPFVSYFEWGRSIEGKLARMTRPTDEESAPIISGAWLEGPAYAALPRKRTLDREKTSIAIYGMSHAHLLGKAMGEMRPDYIIRDVNAPGGVPSRSLSAYEFDRRRTHSDVVMMGIMTDAVPLLLTTSGATSYFDLCYPYTYPRYELRNGALHAEYPPFLDVQGYREYFYDAEKWATYRDWLSRHDKYYDPLLFRNTILDRSSIVRVLRRAYAELTRREKFDAVYTEKGFNVRSEEVAVLQAIVAEFARKAREDHSLPVIYIVNLQGRGDHLFRVLKPVLDRYDIPYLSTHEICPPDDPSLFLPRDTHFLPSKDVELAEEMVRIIEKEKRRGSITILAAPPRAGRDHRLAANGHSHQTGGSSGAVGKATVR